MSLALDLTPIVVAVVGLAGGIAATVQARAANRRSLALERRKLDVDDDRARWERADGIIARLSDEVDRLADALAAARGELTAARHDLEEERIDKAAVLARVGECRDRLIELEDLVELLVAEMRAHGVPVPSAAAG